MYTPTLTAALSPVRLKVTFKADNMWVKKPQKNKEKQADKRERE